MSRNTRNPSSRGRSQHSSSSPSWSSSSSSLSERSWRNQAREGESPGTGVATTRLKPPPMTREVGWQYGLISKQDVHSSSAHTPSGDADQATLGTVDALGLKRHDAQEQLFSALKQQIEQLAAMESESREHQVRVDAIVAAFRKLREGIYASGRVDDFAVEVYETASEVCLLGRNTSELQKSIHHLVLELHTSKQVSAVGRRRQVEFLGYFVLNLVCFSVGEYGLVLPALADFLRRLHKDQRNSPQVEFALSVNRAIQQGNFVQFFRLLSRANRWESIYMKYASEKIRAKSARALAAFMSVPLHTLSEWLGMEPSHCKQWLVHVCSLKEAQFVDAGEGRVEVYFRNAPTAAK